MSTRDAFGVKLVEMGEKYLDLVVLNADLSKPTRTEEFGKRFPDRFFNMGVAEANMVNTAAGLAVCGKVPFAVSLSIFASGRTWDQIRTTICYSNLNVKIVGTHAGVSVGEDGATHQALEDITIMRVIPRMTVIVPADGPETGKALEAAYQHKGPIYIRLGRPKARTVIDKNTQFVIGKGSTLREGNDATIIACGLMVGEALQAAEKLAEDGVQTRVINMPTIKPIDKDLIIDAATATGCIVTAEEHTILGGLGSAVAEVVVQRCPIPMQFIGTQNCYGQSGSLDELLDMYKLRADVIASAVKNVYKQKR